MLIDLRPDLRLRSQVHRGRRQTALHAAPSDVRWKWGMLAVGAVALCALVAAWFAYAASPQQDTTQLTHTTSRGELLVTVTEQGMLESSENTEIKCKVRGQNTVLWVVESGTVVKPGDELVRLDTFLIEEQIDERTKYAHSSQAGAEYFRTQAARAELAVSEYEQGRLVTQLLELEKQLVVAESSLRSATEMLKHTQMMLESGYVSEMDVEEREFALDQARLDVELKRTQTDVLKRFTKAEELETLRGRMAAMKAQYAANAERAMADASRRDRALEEYEHCIVRAERGGLVIHPSAAKWENAPEIAEGTVVHKDQVLLLMPDLSKMQVKVGIHEAVVDRIRPGLSAQVTLPDKTLEGTVSSVASVTRPAGWWTGNEVRYDTIIQLPAVDGLRPGMSAEVEVLIARYQDVLTIPVAALVDTEEASFCWVKTPQGTVRRRLTLGDTNDVSTIVEAGLKEGDEVVLNPPTLAGIQQEMTKPAIP